MGRPDESEPPPRSGSKRWVERVIRNTPSYLGFGVVLFVGGYFWWQHGGDIIWMLFGANYLVIGGLLFAVAYWTKGGRAGDGT